jgi:dTDP-4-dehydrorhamnose 3,5-epimerase
MKISPSPIAGVAVVEMERHADERGWFARTWCTEEFEAHGMNPALTQCSASFNRRRGTLRGMHYQMAPHLETKLVRCTRGACYDVALDLRAGSPTFGQWFAVELSEDNGRALYIPEGCAHGFQTLVDDTEVFYSIAGEWHADSARGVRWNDPKFAIEWPLPAEAFMSDRDAEYPDWAQGTAVSIATVVGESKDATIR